MNFTALLFLACLTGAAQAIRGLKTGKSKKGPSINGIIADATCSNEVSTTGGSASGTLTIAFNNPNPAVFMDVAPGDGVVEDVEAARFAYVFDGDTSTHNTAVVIDGEAYIVTATGFEGVADDSLAMSWTQTGDQTSAPMVSSSAGVLCTLLMDAIPSPTPTPCTVGDNAADPSTINCQNNGVATGTANKCACDCSGTGYSGDTCNLCTTTNVVNTNCAALNDTSIGNSCVNAPGTAIQEWFDDEAAATAKWGHISDWYTGEVTSMQDLFYSKSSFNADIGGWDVSKVTQMGYMFAGAEAFNQPIGSWDVSKVTYMVEMFYYAYAFNQPIGSWDVSKVADMAGMFESAYAFNKPIGSWDVSKATFMGSMFEEATAFNQPIGSWNVSEVTTMYQMFYVATTFNQPIGNWDVSKVEEMDFMFKEATTFSQDLSNWCVELVSNPLGFDTDSGLTPAQLPDWKGQPVASCFA